MSSLADQGLLRRTRSGRYKLGWRIMAMSQILLETTDFRSEARRAMEHLVSRFGELVHLAAFECGQVIYVDKVQGTKAIQVAVTGMGMRLPAHGSGVGKVLLAHRPWEEVGEVLEREGMTELTPNTVTTPERLRSELERVREQGFAYDIEETVLELCCVAAPIRDHTGEVVAAMSFSVPAYRFHQGEERYRTAIVETTRAISESIGYTEVA
jgi:DNA-binding IclR family transcriptional regulator